MRDSICRECAHTVCWCHDDHCLSRYVGRARRSCDKMLKLRSDGGDSGSKKCKVVNGGICVGVWRSFWLAECTCPICVGAFGTNLSSFVKIFWHLIYFIKIFNALFAFNAPCKSNAAMNIITAHQKKKNSSPSNMTGHTLGYYVIIIIAIITTKAECIKTAGRE
jgi:hypothetical protein